MFTKCNFLKKIATLFDPLGLMAPYKIRVKMLLQEMWTAGLEWDGELPELLIHAARAWFGELSDLKQLQISRCLREKGRTSDTMSLHYIRRSSQDAYGAVVYARCTYNEVLFRVTWLPRRPMLHLAYQQYSAFRINGCSRRSKTYHKNFETLEIQLSLSTFWSRVQAFRSE